MVTWLIIIAACIVLAIAIFMFVKKNNETANEGDSSSEGTALLSEVEQRENAIAQVQVKASLLGLPSKTDINALIDKCSQVHAALGSVNPAEKIQLHSAPADFERLIEKHLPETIEKFGQIFENASDEDITKFNDLLAQLSGELDTIITNINARNYAAFANKHGFMEIRYSDKF